jgi:hypothetical protein
MDRLFAEVYPDSDLANKKESGSALKEAVQTVLAQTQGATDRVIFLVNRIVIAATLWGLTAVAFAFTVGWLVGRSH